jgi:hypothetical protein
MAMKSKRIPVLGLEEFSARYAGHDLLAEHPCVVERFVPQWPAYSSWQTYAALAERFGHHRVTAGAPQFASVPGTTVCRVRTDFGRYLRYLESQERARELFEGCWEEGSYEAFAAQGLPLYCGNLPFAASPDDPVLADVQPLLPPGVDCWNSHIPFFYRTYNHFWLYVGVRGALTPLHEDNNAVAAYLGQLAGEKQAILFSPADLEHVHREGVGWVDPLDPDRALFPTFDEAQPWEATLRPGQLLIWGGRWAHHVRTTADSITLSFDFINATNVVEFVRRRQWLTVMGEHARKYRGQIPVTLPDSAEEWRLGQAAVSYLLERQLQVPGEGPARAVKERLLALVSAEA